METNDKMIITVEEYNYLVTVGVKAGILVKGILDSAKLNSYSENDNLIFDHDIVETMLKAAATVEYNERMAELREVQND